MAEPQRAQPIPPDQPPASPIFHTASTRPDMAEVLCVLSASGVIRFATPATAHFFGYALDDIIGRSALRFIAPEHHDAVTARWQAYQHDPDLASENMLLPVVTAFGRHLPIRASAWRLPDRDESLLVLHLVEHLQDRLETLYSILTRVSGKLEIDPVLDIVQHELDRLIPVSVCTVFLQVDEHQVRVRQWDQDEQRDYRLPHAQLPDFETTRLMRETGKPVLIDDTTTDPRWQPAAGGPYRDNIHSWLGVPLIHHGEFLGELNLDSPHPNAFTEEDAELAHALASQIAAVVFHARQLDEEHHQAARYRVLNDISQAISELDLRSVLELVYRQISGLMDTSTFFIGLYDAEVNIVRLVGAYDHGRPAPDDVQRADEGLTGRVLRTRQPVIIHDSAREPLPDEAIIEDEMPRSLIMMPLLTHDETVGVLTVQSYEPNAYTAEDIAMLDTIAGAIATAVHNAQLYDQAVERFKSLETLHRMVLVLAAIQQPDEIARLVTITALALFNPHQVRLCLCSAQLGDEATWFATGDPAEPRVERRQEATSNAFAEQVRHTCQPILITDMNNDPALQTEFDTPWLVQAAAIYPIQRSGQMFAVLNLLYGEPHFFRQDMLTTLDMLALQVATSFQNARYLDTLHRQLHEVTALQDLARQVSALHSLDDVLETTVYTLRDVYQCKAAWLAQVDHETGTLTIDAVAGDEPRHGLGVCLPLDEHIAGRVIQNKKAIYVADTSDVPDQPIGKTLDPAVRSMMIAPLTIHGRILGALGIDSDQPHAFAEGHQRFLNIAGGQIAATIETLHLLAEAREQAENLAEANRVLQEQDDLRRELVYQVSHDLRSPLQIVYGYADMLHQAELGPVTPLQTDVLELMLKRTRSIEQMTRDIMAAKPINRASLELAEIDLNQLCQQSMVDARMISAEREHLDFQIALAPGELLVEADYDRLSRVLDNLLGNAVKFSPDGGTITLRTERTDDGRALVSISDQGIGIPEDKLPFLFERFFRVERKRFAGSGLGLFIVQQIVDAHQGEVQVESQPGQGSTFTVTLPLVANSA